MKNFADIYEQAVKRKGSKKRVEDQLPKAKSKKQLLALADDRYLSEMSRRVFRAGLKHAMVDKKWPAFEIAFKQFNPTVVARFSDEQLEALASDKSIIRHFGKIRAVRNNALMVTDVAAEYGSFGKMISKWPEDDIVSLWMLLKKKGSSLGGHSGARFLRMVGKDTFLLTDDVVAVLHREGVLGTLKTPTSKRDFIAVQTAFNQWHEESKRPYSEISRIVSMSTGENFI
ncbi:MAG: DNA-3-methyladenine glycosylase I [Cellvibrionaceae bacterium]